MKHELSSLTQKFLAKENWPHYINGQFEKAQEEASIEVVNSSNGNVIAEVSEANQQEVDKAVKAAYDALHHGPWNRMLPNEREKLMLKIADIIELHRTSFAEIIVLENGKLINDAKREVSSTINCFRYFAGLATKIEGSTVDVSLSGGSHFAFTKREPIGVVGAIAPWNVPLQMFSWKVAPAMACGCTVVFKSSENTPLSALFLLELITELDIPKGVINVLSGTGSITGDSLVKHPLVSKLSFTGSTKIGKMIGKNAMDDLKDFTLELGGKNPVLVLADANFDKVAKGVSKGIFYNQGQICVSGSRLYLPKNKFEKTLADMASIADGMKVSHGFDPDAQMGPLVSEGHFNSVLSHIEQAKSDQLELLSGGTKEHNEGFYIRPTIFANTEQKDVPLTKEEVFGPVIVATPYDTIEELIEKANNTIYGLSACIWTQDLSNAHYLIDKLQAGVIYVNSPIRSDPNLPLGGFKQSGIGRELGKAAIETFTEIKSVVIKY